MKETIKQALEKATPGPWIKAIDKFFNNTKAVSTENGYGVAYGVKIEDCHLIANAPTWLRWQNERIEELEKEVLEAKREASDERRLSADIVAERERLYIRLEELEKALYDQREAMFKDYWDAMCKVVGTDTAYAIIDALPDEEESA